VLYLQALLSVGAELTIQDVGKIYLPNLANVSDEIFVFGTGVSGVLFPSLVWARGLRVWDSYATAIALSPAFRAGDSGIDIRRNPRLHSLPILTKGTVNCRI
jgi:hypothetical protein